MPGILCYFQTNPEAGSVIITALYRSMMLLHQVANEVEAE